MSDTLELMILFSLIFLLIKEVFILLFQIKSSSCMGCKCNKKSTNPPNSNDPSLQFDKKDEGMFFLNNK